MEEMRALLDSLMGADRNCVASDVLNGTRPPRKSFRDRDVCRYYLVDFCPHDLFPNTKSDLGPCPHLHSDPLKEQFETDIDNDHYRYLYEHEFMEKLQRLLDVVEQRIRKGNERILGPDESQLEQDREKKSEIIKADVAKLLEQAQEAGEAGNIAEAENLTKKADELRREIDRLSASTFRSISALSAQEKSLRVCNVCGAMQSLGDAASRFESHVAGKQHTGYERIRAVLAALQEKYKGSEGPPPRKNGPRPPPMNGQLRQNGGAPGPPQNGRPPPGSQYGRRPPPPRGGSRSPRSRSNYDHGNRAWGPPGPPRYRSSYQGGGSPLYHRNNSSAPYGPPPTDSRPPQHLPYKQDDRRPPQMSRRRHSHHHRSYERNGRSGRKKSTSSRSYSSESSPVERSRGREHHRRHRHRRRPSHDSRSSDSTTDRPRRRKSKSRRHRSKGTDESGSSASDRSRSRSKRRRSPDTSMEKV